MANQVRRFVAALPEEAREAIWQECAEWEETGVIKGETLRHTSRDFIVSIGLPIDDMSVSAFMQSILPEVWRFYAVQARDAGYVPASEVQRAREADNALVDRYRDPKTGSFSFPSDVAAIIRRLEGERDSAREEALATFAEPLAVLPRGPWETWTSNSYRRITGPDGKDGGVLHALNHRSDGHPDLSWSAAQCEAICAIVNGLRALTAPPAEKG